jgi:hypothetical protein
MKGKVRGRQIITTLGKFDTHIPLAEATTSGENRINNLKTINKSYSLKEAD